MSTAPILALTTGGTIDKQYFDALSEYQVGETAVGMLLRMARVAAPFRIEEVLRKDSLELTDADRALIAAKVAKAPETHIVITHGTDTMTDTAQVLAGIEGKTVVLTGALIAGALCGKRCRLQPGHGFRRCADLRARHLYRDERAGVRRAEGAQGPCGGQIHAYRLIPCAPVRQSRSTGQFGQSIERGLQKRWPSFFSSR